MNRPIIPVLELPVNNIYCIGRNYSEHAKELGNSVPDVPMVFIKPSGTIAYSGDTVHLPSQSKDVHHEVELVAAVSKTGKNISRKTALDFIAGYGIGIDFTARDLQQKAKEKGHPWSVAKGFDSFAPISSFIKKDKVENPGNLNLSLSVNGELCQNGNTSQMIFPVEELISYLSTIFTLQPGDLIFTGTPSGVGPVKSGDVLTAKLQNGLTTLTVSIA